MTHYNNDYDRDYNIDVDLTIIDKKIYVYVLLALIMLAMICPMGVSVYFITLYVNPVSFSDYLSLIIGIVSLFVTMYFGILFQFSNFHKIINRVEKICKTKITKSNIKK